MVINGMEADKYLCEQACQGHGGDGRESENQSARERESETERKLRTDTFSSSWQLILVPSSLSSIPKWNYPSLITPPLPLLSLPPLIRPPAYSPLPQLHLFPWKHRIKRVTSRLNQRFWSAENITSSFESCSSSSGWYSIFSFQIAHVCPFLHSKKKDSSTAYSLTDANYKTCLSLWDQWMAPELTVFLSSCFFFFFPVFQGFVGVPQICLTNLSAATVEVQRRILCIIEYPG